MIWEFLVHCLDRGSSLARRFGHDREAVSIAARHGRCRAAWAAHLAATKSCILDAATACPGRGEALILGSGLCLDVPVPELAALFGRVTLVDAHHPRPARRLAKAFANVRLLEADVTGMGRAVLQAARGKADLPCSVPVPDPLPDLAPDFTASVNLASQLPIPFARLLSRRVTPEMLEIFGRELIKAHFDWLERLSGRVCLVCDAAWQRLEDGRVSHSRDALEGVALPPPDRTWTWDIAPRPEESPAYDRRNLVWGYLDFARVRRGQAMAFPNNSL